MEHAGLDPALRELLAASTTLQAAQLTPDGTIVTANAAFARALGRDPAGEAFAALIAEPQRAVLAARLQDVGDHWDELTLGFWAGGAVPAEDRRVRLRRDGEHVLAVVEADADERDRLVEQVLQLNDDLIASQRDLARRQRELARAQAGAEEAGRRVGQLEAVLLTGLRSHDLDSALRRVLHLANDVIGTERAAITTLDRDRGVLRVRATLGLDPRLGTAAVRLGRGVSGTIAALGRGMIFDDVEGLAVDTDERPLDFHGSLAGVPLMRASEVIGVLHVSSPETGRFTEEDLRLLEAVGERASLAIGHAELRERERRLTETLQHSLLPQGLPDLPGLELDARYLPREVDADLVGGDFYDVLELSDGRVGLVIGDVAGKGLRAASEMGQIRAALHAHALEDAHPGRVLERLDRFTAAMDMTATALALFLDPGTGAGVVACAGHPPALVVDGGRAVYADCATGPPLGTAFPGRGEAHLTLARGASVLLFTDGLVERRERSLQAGLDGLLDVAEVAPGDPATLCDGVLAALKPRDGWPDDVALLAARRV